MKTNQFFIVVLCLISTISFAQDVTRIEINGNILVDRNDLEGVTVFNASSNKGTVTDKDGHFVLEVGLNDSVEFAALQFKNFVIVVTQDIIDAKAMTVLLVERINKLPEVVILPHNLTGNLLVDTNSTELVNPNLDALYFGLNNLNKIEFDNEHLETIENVALEPNKIEYQADIKKIIGIVLSPFFKFKPKKISVKIYKKSNILDVYDKDYLMAALKIVERDLVEFVYYVEEDSFNFALLELNREFEFLEFLKSQEQKFVAIKYGKD